MEMMRQGRRDVERRVTTAWLLLARWRIARDLDAAETELGFLAWQRVDIFDESIAAEVAKVREFEHAQAGLMNTSAELAGRKAQVEAGLAAAAETRADEVARLAAARVPLEQQLAEAESRRALRAEAACRFQAAIDEFSRREKELQARSDAMMRIERPTVEDRVAARDASLAIERAAGERKQVAAAKADAAEDVTRLDAQLAGIREEIRQLDSRAETADTAYDAAVRQARGALGKIEADRKASDLNYSHLDKRKRRPYRVIGSCLADTGIAPMNQPEILARVLDLRARDAALAAHIETLRGEGASADRGAIAGFYIIAGVTLLMLLLVTVALTR